MTEEEAEALRVENRVLREFYDAWVFMHHAARDKTDAPKWDLLRQKKAAQLLVEAHHSVQRHIKHNTAAAAH